MANVVVNFNDGDKVSNSSLRESLEKRHIAYEEKKEGNMTVIYIKAKPLGDNAKKCSDSR